jgi:Domain of unknown function (DUF5063)
VELIAAAERYCSLIERAESLERGAFIEQAAVALSEVVSQAFRLPDVYEDSGRWPDEPGPDAQSSERLHALEELLGPWDLYRSTFMPFGEDAEDAMDMSLADDLFDVWGELKWGLEGLGAGIPLDEVTWHWRDTFYEHWGGWHALQALRVLHARMHESLGY